MQNYHLPNQAPKQKVIQLWCSVIGVSLGLVLLLAGVATLGLPVKAVNEPALMSWVRAAQKIFNWLLGGLILLAGGIMGGALTLGWRKASDVFWFRLIIRSSENLFGAAILLVVGLRMSVFAHASWKGHVYTESEFFLIPGILTIFCSLYLGASAFAWEQVKSLPCLKETEKIN